MDDIKELFDQAPDQRIGKAESKRKKTVRETFSLRLDPDVMKNFKKALVLNDEEQYDVLEEFMKEYTKEVLQ